MPALEESLFPRPPSWRGSYTDRTGLAARNRGLRRLTSGGARREGLMAPEGISRPEPRGGHDLSNEGIQCQLGTEEGPPPNWSESRATCLLEKVSDCPGRSSAERKRGHEPAGLRGAVLRGRRRLCCSGEQSLLASRAPQAASGRPFALCSPRAPDDVDANRRGYQAASAGARRPTGKAPSQGAPPPPAGQYTVVPCPRLTPLLPGLSPTDTQGPQENEQSPWQVS